MQVSRLSQRWRFRSRSFGLWRHIVLWYDHAASIFWVDIWNIGILPQLYTASQPRRSRLGSCPRAFNWAPRHEGVLGSGDSSMHSWPRYYMEVSGKLHAPASLRQWKESLVLIRDEAGWAREPVWTRMWREKFPAPTGTRIPGHPVCSLALYTELSRPSLTWKLCIIPY
jgi:hypothetical protein